MATGGVVLALGTEISGAAPGARESLRVLERELGAGAVVNVVAVVGFNGDDQPETWKLLVRDAADPAVLEEVAVAGGRIVARNPMRRADFDDLPEKPVTTASLKVDSTEAYRIADDEAILAGATFARLHYQLRFRGNDPAPTWLVTLVNAAGETAGYVVIDASDGSIPFQDFPGSNLLAAGNPGASGAEAGSALPDGEPPLSGAASGAPSSGRATYSDRPAQWRNRVVGPRTKRGGAIR